MKIKGTTSSYCKITDVKISGFKAYIYLLISSTSSQVDPVTSIANTCVFSFYTRDSNGELNRVTNNNYWIDRCNNYNNDMNNIDINKHKDIILELDITNKNTSTMQDNKWVRPVELLLINNRTNEEAWTSDTIELISKEISLPEINNFNITKTSSTINISFDLVYSTQEDFNYINSNIIAKLQIRSVYTKKLIESMALSSFNFNSLQPIKHINTALNNYYTEPIQIEICIQNLKEDILKEYIKFYNTELALSPISILSKDNIKHCTNASIKTKDGIKPIIKIS